MIAILVTGAGGAPSTNFIRSLRMAPEKFTIIGTDADPYYLQRSEADTNYLAPKASDPAYFPIINGIIKKERIDCMHMQNDTEIGVVSARREKIHTNLFLPTKDVIARCHNKYTSFLAWREAGLPVPQTMPINSPEDLEVAFATLGPKLWLRNTTGAAGRGALPTSDLPQATAWINFHSGWGSFVAARYLSPNSITWMSIWHHGKLIVAQGRKRLYWEMGKIAPSGITGMTGGGITVRDGKLDRVARKAILAIDSSPHGLYGVDLTYDQNRVPNPTEINIGRFFTTHHFFTQAGVNMPYIYIKLALGQRVKTPARPVNPLPPGNVWIRGMDFLPILTTDKKIKQSLRQLEKLRKKFKE